MQKNDSGKKIKITAKELLKRYTISFVVVALLVFWGHSFSLCINSYHIFSDYYIGWLQAVALVPGSVALFPALRSWDFQTWSGNSYVEILDQKILLFLSGLSVFMLALVAGLGI